MNLKILKLNIFRKNENKIHIYSYEYNEMDHE
jgi:hypothetical protein